MRECNAITLAATLVGEGDEYEGNAVLLQADYRQN